jgi:hypothetical protein
MGLLLVGPPAARAYTISSPIGTGCHESISSEALRRVRRELATAVPLPATRNEQALIDDVDYRADEDMKDLGATSLLLGVRDNDVKGRSSADLTQLALVHGNPQAQDEHCLRSADQAEPGGTRAALDACRAFIRKRASEAIEGLDSQGMPDAGKRTSLSVYLQLRHHVDAPLPTYYVRIGQAIHAVEDSFSHTYRTPDGAKITVILNWVSEADGTLLESSNGPPHASELDRCDDPDDLRKRRHQLAIDASAAMLRATLNPGMDTTQKLAAVDAVLEAYLGSSEGCTFQNGWCQAPEHAYKTGYSLGCNVAPWSSRSPSPWLIVLAACALAARRRRGRAPGRRLGLLAAGSVLLAGNALAKPAVDTQASTPPGATAEQVQSPPSTLAAKEAPPSDPSRTALGAFIGGSGSVDYPAFALQVGLRLLGKRWTFGVDAEWNPFIKYNDVTVRAGVLNAYGTAILRIPLTYEQFNLRTTLNLGASRLLMDLYGAPKGSTGVYAGFSPLGLAWRLNRIVYLIINPLNFALPAPQLGGVPFTYPQYRATIGVELYRG